jgi:RimJ/RimL family protein N-acetyltransferase
MKGHVNGLGQPVGFPVPDWRPPPHPSRHTLNGHFCRLEPLDPDRHAEALFRANALDTDGRGWTYLPYGPFADGAAYAEWMRATCLGDDPLFYAIVDLATGEPAGVASYLRIDPRNGSIEVGHLRFSPLLQRKPAATEAMFLMMQHAFALGYRRYEWKCDVLNAPSCAAALRLGLSYEGIFRQATVYKGRSRDSAWFAAIDSEWPALQRAFETWLAPENFDARGEQRLSLSSLTSPVLVRRS